MRHVASGIDIDLTFGGLAFEQAAVADVTRVRQWVREFATATGMGDMLDEFDKLLAKRKSR